VGFDPRVAIQAGGGGGGVGGGAGGGGVRGSGGGGARAPGTVVSRFFRFQAVGQYAAGEPRPKMGRRLSHIVFSGGPVSHAPGCSPSLGAVRAMLGLTLYWFGHDPLFDGSRQNEPRPGPGPRFGFAKNTRWEDPGGRRAAAWGPGGVFRIAGRPWSPCAIPRHPERFMMSRSLAPQMKPHRPTTKSWGVRTLRLQNAIDPARGRNTASSRRYLHGGFPRPSGTSECGVRKPAIAVGDRPSGLAVEQGDAGRMYHQGGVLEKEEKGRVCGSKFREKFDTTDIVVSTAAKGRGAVAGAGDKAGLALLRDQRPGRRSGRAAGRGVPRDSSTVTTPTSSIRRLAARRPG